MFIYRKDNMFIVNYFYNIINNGNEYGQNTLYDIKT